MAEYHVGCGMFGIYAGLLNKEQDKWRAKTDVTNEAMCAVAQYMLENDKEFHFSCQGRQYRLVVEVIK